MISIMPASTWYTRCLRRTRLAGIFGEHHRQPDTKFAPQAARNAGKTLQGAGLQPQRSAAPDHKAGYGPDLPVHPVKAYRQAFSLKPSSISSSDLSTHLCYSTDCSAAISRGRITSASRARRIRSLTTSLEWFSRATGHSGRPSADCPCSHKAWPARQTGHGLTKN